MRGPATRFAALLLMAALPAQVQAQAQAQVQTQAAGQSQTGPQGSEERQNPTPGQIGNPPPPEGSAPGEGGSVAQLFGPSRTNLLGDMFGLRTTLGNYGISLGLQETSEVLGNVSGGLRRAVAYDGLTSMSMGLDTQKAFGWEGGTFNISALQIRGHNLSAETLLNLQNASSIEATPATRLWELWYQQTFLGGRMDIKIGQQAIDQEFINSAYGGIFLNTAMGWPVLPSSDLYAGGPTYPLSSLGVRFRARPSASVTVLAGVFNDNPPGGPFNNDLQVRGAEQSGTRFNLNTGALFIAEIQYAVNPPAEGEQASGMNPPGSRPPTSLAPGTIRRRFPTSATTMPAFRWPIPAAPAWPACGGPISACMPWPTRWYGGRTRSRHGRSACSPN